MKMCKNCKVKVSTNHKICPLCRTVLVSCDDEEVENTYPEIKANLHKYNVITRAFLFLSIIGIFVTAIINYLTFNGFWWSVIPIASILYFWSIISHAIKNNINIVRKILVQTICVSILTIIIDITTGYNGWSVNYVVPGLIITANVAVLVLIILNRMNWIDYVIYQVVIAILGFIPIVLYFLKITDEIWLNVTSVMVSFMILCGTIIFSDANVKNELKRRLHF